MSSFLTSFQDFPPFLLQKVFPSRQHPTHPGSHHFVPTKTAFPPLPFFLFLIFAVLAFLSISGLCSECFIPPDRVFFAKSCLRGKVVILDIKGKRAAFAEGTTFAVMAESVKKYAGDEVDFFEFINEKKKYSLAVDNEIQMSPFWDISTEFTHK